jgi:2',3'-cyclic-nucleotide 2'-phosphodiesterase (5'-nucleotidase family)
MTRSLPGRLGRSKATMPLLALTAGALVLSSGAVAAQRPAPVELQFLTVSDWHAQLDPVNGVGGAAALSTYFQQERAANPNTLTLTAGDAYGASPPLANFFEERPAVEAMNLMGFDVDTFGNHNFDRGTDHLQQMIDLAEFPYVSSNLRNRDDNLTGVKDFEIFTVGGVDVAVIGVTNPEAPTLVFPGSFGTIEVTDPVPAANKARAAAKRAGADVFVAITHMGITGVDQSTGEAFGPLVDFADNVGGFDIVFGDHTDFQYEGVHNGALVVENKSKGVTYARTTLTVQPTTGKVLTSDVEFVVPTAAAVTPDPAVVELLAPYRAELAPLLNAQVGSATREILRSDSCGRGDGRLCESLVGNTVTDAMRMRYGTDFAITNSGGLRSSLTCPTTDNLGDFCPAYDPAGGYPITRGQVLSVLPFGNVAVTGTITGAELDAMLENGVSSMPGANGRFAQVSGLCFTYDISAAPGSRVSSAVRQAADGTCTGEPIDLTAASTYTMAQNDFMATGGDGYPNVFSSIVSREILDQVLADYVTASSPISPAIQGRIVCTSSGATACPAITAP